MKKKRHTPEQIIKKLRTAGEEQARGTSIEEVCRKLEISGNGVSVQILTECREGVSKRKILRPLAEKRELDIWEKIVNITKDEWVPSRLPFGKFKG